MIHQAYKHARLMEESEWRLERTADSLAPADVLVAQRILGRPEEFTRWEVHHDHLMRAVSSRDRLTHQMEALRATALALVHRDLELAETEEEKQTCIAQECLKGLLKYRVNEARRAILAMPQIPCAWREVQIRRPTGDTQRLRTLTPIGEH